MLGWFTADGRFFQGFYRLRWWREPFVHFMGSIKNDCPMINWIIRLWWVNGFPCPWVSMGNFNYLLINWGIGVVGMCRPHTSLHWTFFDGLKQILDLPLFIFNLLSIYLVGIDSIIQSPFQLSNFSIEQYLLTHQLHILFIKLINLGLQSLLRGWYINLDSRLCSGLVICFS